MASEPALTLAGEVSALGVCRAHSGTILGLLLDPAQADAASIAAFAARRLPGAVTVECFSLVDGGPRFSVEWDETILQQVEVMYAS